MRYDIEGIKRMLAGNTLKGKCWLYLANGRPVVIKQKGDDPAQWDECFPFTGKGRNLLSSFKEANLIASMRNQ